MIRRVKRVFVTATGCGTALFASLLLSFSGNGDAWADAPVNQLNEAERRGGWELLFDGQSMDQWRNYQKDGLSDGWKVTDGQMIRAEKDAGDIVTKDKYEQFELLLEYKISEGGNSGVIFRVTEDNPRPWHSGPEIQIQDNVDGHDPQKAGWLYQLYKPLTPSWAQERGPIDATRPAGQWNQLYVRITNDQSEVCMNGVRYYTFKIGDKNWNEKVAESKFSKFEGFGKAASGHICLQDHGNEVAFRNVKVRRLAEDGSVKQPIDGNLNLSGELAFPKLKWGDPKTDSGNWEPVDPSGKIRPLRLMELTYANGDSNRLYAASQYGAIWSFENNRDTVEAPMFLDLRDQVYDWKNRGANEQGLLGLAMHPSFKDNGKFYVYYTHKDGQRSIVSQFKVSADNPLAADPASELVLMDIPQPYANHNGGSIEFGPDGFLYIALGDGGDRNDPKAAGQDLSALLGSILRIDVDHPADGKPYGIPSDNPFVKNPDACPEIYAMGVRNPWRIAFDKKTGDLWMGDVGQELWEEVNIITKGGNYGWSNREGLYGFGNREDVAGVPDPIDPIWQYDHRVGKSITGGRVYHSDRVPELTGKYVYADYVTGMIWALTYDRETGKVVRNEQVVPDSIAVLAFGEDQNGEVYYLTDSSRGECIYRFKAKD
ncbi:PQQ-dependent sugar dehydrogenase [Stieleria varia]|uniref:Soluble aldose sugar dehydrogenase YliI n=1 Tax=Stieleria varia TaxID=2528005 RepID=A0A5C6B386_9BACT|nr:PQQ-dependent sugar dehydrogenase [Stieleria varia]TWU06257.1 Soluble aldose sugar dehydrogenase YliI precursor [Stieleria varia]